YYSESKLFAALFGIPRNCLPSDSTAFSAASVDSGGRKSPVILPAVFAARFLLHLAELSHCMGLVLGHLPERLHPAARIVIGIRRESPGSRGEHEHHSGSDAPQSRFHGVTPVRENVYASHLVPRCGPVHPTSMHSSR